MPWKIIEADMNINKDRLIDMVCDGIFNLESSDGNIDGDQGRFISCRTGGYVIALCFHKTKEHSAFVEVDNNVTGMFGFRDKIKRSADCKAPPGKWAAAWCDSGKFGGNEAYYKIW